MSSRHLIDPELLASLDAIPDMSVSLEKLSDTRALVAQMTEMGMGLPDPTVTASEHFAPGRNGSPDVRLILYRPADLSDRAPVVFHIHGGGFLFGTAEMDDPRNRATAKALNCVVAAVDYRLAPETPYPGALDDCHSAFNWIHQNAAELNIDPDRIAVRGESAGGGLAAALAIMARDAGAQMPCFQLLIYPMLDDRTVMSEPKPYAGDFVWNASSNYFSWQCWLGVAPGGTDIPPLAAPARVEDLSGLPRTFIATAALDLFIDENLEYAKRLIRAGVSTELYVAPGAYHGFEAMAPGSHVSRLSNRIQEEALIRAFLRS